MATKSTKAAAAQRVRTAKNVKQEKTTVVTGIVTRQQAALSPKRELAARVKAAAAPFEGGVPVAKPAKPAKAAKLPKLKIPKSLGACADLLKELEAARLAAEKHIAPMKAQEAELRNHIINNLPKSQLGGAAGKKYRAEIKRKQVPQIEDRAKLQAYIKKTGDFDLLSAGINAKAVAERWENKKKIPGVVAFEVVSLSVTKL